MPMPMNQIESLRLQGAYHSPRLRLGNLREEIVKLDTNLMNRDTLRKAAFQHFVLETLDINFQQVDEIVPMNSISRARLVQGRVSLPPAFSHVLEAVPPPIEKFATVDAAKPMGLKRRCVSIRQGDRTGSDWSRIEYVDLNPKPSNQFLLEGNIFAYAAAVDHGVGVAGRG